MFSRITKRLARWIPLASFGGSANYWRKRYQLGGDSGVGSAGAAATYKAAVLNDFVVQEDVTSVIEFGCGDGRQLALAKYPSYLGLDISPDAIERCRKQFQNDPRKRFAILDDRVNKADLALSLDVIFHLVEDDVYVAHLRRLFDAANRFVIIYSSNREANARTFKHVRHRVVSTDVASLFPEFEQLGDLEAALPPPVETSSGVPTVFLLYRRRQYQ
jgi:SAM-dependent methyltransferase